MAVLVISSRKGEYETGFEKGGQVRGEGASGARSWQVFEWCTAVMAAT